MVIPKNLVASCSVWIQKKPLHPLWFRRHLLQNSTEYPTPCRKPPAAIFTPEGKEEVRATINYYMNNAKILRESLPDWAFRSRRH